MEKTYIETVRLLLEAMPVVFQTPTFAMKGGTAINLFVEDMPRLSVDIDVVFTDHQMSREQARCPFQQDWRWPETNLPNLALMPNCPPPTRVTKSSCSSDVSAAR
jgi:hypothetical protein